jgi:hypothetical protein
MSGMRRFAKVDHSSYNSKEIANRKAHIELIMTPRSSVEVAAAMTWLFPALPPYRG